MRACPLGRVEREVVRRWVRVTYACSRTHQALGEMLHAARVLVENHNESVALFHGDADRLLEAFDSSAVGRGNEFVDHHLDVVVLITVHLHAAGNLHHLSVDADIQIALAAHGLEEFTVVTFTASYQRSENQDFLTVIVLKDHVDDALLGVFHHLLASGITIGTAGTGKEQTQVVVDLGGGAHGGTWVSVGGLLLNTNNRRETCNLIDIGAFHAAEEVAGVGREGLDIAALTLGKDGVEGQTGFARAAESGDDGEGVVRDNTVDVLQIVYPGTIYIDACLFFHADGLFVVGVAFEEAAQ